MFVLEKKKRVFLKKHNPFEAAFFTWPPIYTLQQKYILYNTEDPIVAKQTSSFAAAEDSAVDFLLPRAATTGVVVVVAVAVLMATAVSHPIARSCSSRTHQGSLSQRPWRPSFTR